MVVGRERIVEGRVLVANGHAAVKQEYAALVITTSAAAQIRKSWGLDDRL